MNLAEEIEELKLELIKLAEQKADPLNDPEVYQKSCQIDKKIVEFLKLKKEKKEII